MAKDKNEPNPRTKKNLWKQSVDQIRRALAPKTGKLEDSVRVHIGQKGTYLSETAISKQIKSRGEVVPVKKLTLEERKESRVHYDKKTQSLMNNKDQIVTTKNKTVKDLDDAQAFVMTKKGTLYIGPHTDENDINIKDSKAELYTHGTFVNDIPVEMAGLISINENGKINKICKDSGHYQPDEVDTYRFIKRLEKDMPNVLTSDAVIMEYRYSDDPITVSDFIGKMEKPGDDGKTLHETLKNQRIQKIEDYKHLVKNATSMVITATGESIDISHLISNLDPDKQKELANVIKNPGGAIVVKDKNNEVINSYSIPKLAEKIIESNDMVESTESMKILIKAGIGGRKDFQKLMPLTKIINKKEDNNLNYMAAGLLLKDSNARNILKYENDNTESILHKLSVPTGSQLNDNRNKNLIMDIVKFPEGQSMLDKRDYDEMTPVQIAQKTGNIQVLNALNVGIEIRDGIYSAKTEINKPYRPRTRNTKKLDNDKGIT